MVILRSTYSLFRWWLQQYHYSYILIAATPDYLGIWDVIDAPDDLED